MPIVKCKPTSPGRRFVEKVVHPHLFKGRPLASLVEPKKRTGGRNNNGHITTRHIGGGHKQLYRLIDFKRNKDGVPAVVERVEYDPNRTAFIALLNYADGEKRYILAPQGLKVGQTVVAGKGAVPEVGNALFLSEIPLGAIIHNLELQPGQKASMIRSAGAYGQLIAREGRYATIKFPSGETRLVLLECKATIGAVSNADHNLQIHGKAGVSRWQGRRPRVRGVVMNPVDHPMGGGEGRATGGHPRSRNGKAAKGLKTRKLKNLSNKFIVERRKKK